MNDVIKEVNWSLVLAQLIPWLLSVGGTGFAFLVAFIFYKSKSKHKDKILALARFAYPFAEAAAKATPMTGDDKFVAAFGLAMAIGGNDIRTAKDQQALSDEFARISAEHKIQTRALSDNPPARSPSLVLDSNGVPSIK